MAEWYEALGIRREASEEDIKQAYRAMLRKHRPEKDPEGFMLVRKAYEVLSDPTARSEYDEYQIFLEEVLPRLKSAQAAIDGGAFGDAVYLCRRILDFSPDLAVARNLLGLAHFYSGQLDAAQAELEKLTLNETENPAYLYNLAMVYEAQGYYSSAGQLLRKALALDEQNKDIMAQLVTTLIRNEEYEDALGFIEEAIDNELSPEGSDYTYIIKRVEVYLAIGNEAGVMETLSDIANSEPADHDIRRQLAHNLQVIGAELLDNGSHELAVKFLETAAHLDGDSPLIQQLHRRAISQRLHELGSYSMVYPEKESVIRLLEDQLAEGNIEAVLGALADIIAKVPTHPDSDIHLAHRLQAIGDRLLVDGSYELAAKFLEAAAHLDSDDPDIEQLHRKAINLWMQEIGSYRNIYSPGENFDNVRRPVNNGFEQRPPDPPRAESTSQAGRKDPAQARTAASSRPVYEDPRGQAKLSGWMVVALICVALFIFYNFLQGETPVAPTRIVRPQNGSVLLNSVGGGEGEWIIENGLGRDAVVLLTAGSDSRRTMLSVYIRARNQHKVSGIRDGYYYVYYTTGDDFDEISKSFTKNADYGRFDSVFSFSTTTTEYTVYTISLHGVTDGNASTRKVPASSFPKID